MSFSENLKHILQARGMTVYRLAKELGVPKSTVYTWMGGTKNPSSEHILALSKFLGVSVEDLLM